MIPEYDPIPAFVINGEKAGDIAVLQHPPRPIKVVARYAQDGKEYVKIDDPISHDDYTRLITYVKPAEFLLHPANEELFKQVRDVQGRSFISLHVWAFGCKPIECTRCQSPENTGRVLGTDEHGNPVE